MTNTMLTLLLSLQMALPDQLPASQNTVYHPTLEGQPQKTWWGLIDPDLALWFSRLPEETDGTGLWDWSWRGFLNALFPQSVFKEDSHVPAL